MSAIMGRFRVGTRIYVGFGVILALLAAVTFSGDRNLRLAIADHDESSRISHLTHEVLRIEAELGQLRRNVVAFVYTGGSDSLRLAREAGTAVRQAVDAVVPSFRADRRRQLAAQMRRTFESYLANFERVVTLRARRDQLLEQEMDVAGPQALANLNRVIELAEASGDSAAATLAGQADERLLIGRLSAMRFLNTAAADDAAAVRQRLAGSIELAQRLQRALSDPEARRLSQEAEGLLQRYLAAFDQVAETVTAYQGLVSGPMVQEAGEVARLAEDLAGDMAAEVAANDREIDAAGAAAVATNLALSGGALLLGGLLAWLIARGIVKPVTGMTATMTRLATGDRTIAVPALANRDEIGAMAKAVEVFKRNAIEMERLQVEQEAAKAKAEAERRATMNRTADEFEVSMRGVVETVSAASAQMQASAQSMATVAEQASRQATTVAAAAEEASENVETVSSAAEELTGSIAEITRRIEDATRIARGAVDQAGQTDAGIRDLDKAAERIGNVVKLIETIAGQVNLLALNATIEAARAGEAGKGFAVVATEVKNLANQTASATQEIAQQIGGVQSETKKAVAAIGGIVDTIKLIDEISTAIASAVEEQSAATQEIARNVQQASAGTAEVSKTIAEVTEGAAHAGAVSAQVLKAAQQLAAQSGTLRQAADGFVVKVRAG